MFTEAEAHKKWCPFARVAVAMKNNKTTLEFFGVGGCNRGPLSDQVATVGTATPSNPDSARCIASDCMAWRWRGVPSKRSDGHVLGTTVIGSTMKTPGVGYCGLAGAP